MSAYRANIWKLYGFQWLLSLHFIGGVLVPFFTEWGQISYFQIMLLQSFFVFSVFILEIPTGTVADFLGRKVSLILAAIISAAGVLVYGSYQGFAAFMLAEFLLSVSLALVSGADEALIYDSLKMDGAEKRSRQVFGRYRSVQMFGLLVSAPIGSAIAATLGLRYSVLLMAIPFCLACLVAFSIKEPTLARSSEPKRYWDILTGGVRYFREHRILRLLAFDQISISVLSFFVIWTYQPLLTELGLPLLYFGLVHAGLAAIQMLILNSFEVWERMLGSRKKYLLVSAFLPGAGFLVLGYSPWLLLSIPCMLLVAGFGLTRRTFFQSFLNKYIESENRATVLSTISMFQRISMAILYPLVGVLVEWSLRATLIMLGSLILFLALASRVEESHLAD